MNLKSSNNAVSVCFLIAFLAMLNFGKVFQPHDWTGGHGVVHNRGAGNGFATFFIACLLPRLPLFLHVAWLEAARPWETRSFFKSPQSLLRNPNVKSITSFISLEVVVHQGRFVSASRQLMNFQTSLTSKRSRALL